MPLVYCFLPNKEGKTYEKLFRMLNDIGINTPKIINVDFEKAIYWAGMKVFGSIEIHGCFFHLSQAWMNRLSNVHRLKSIYFKKPEFRKCFKMLQSLAYLKMEDVEEGFNYITSMQKYSNNETEFLNYIRKNYIGNFFELDRHYGNLY